MAETSKSPSEQLRAKQRAKRHDEPREDRRHSTSDHRSPGHWSKSPTDRSTQWYEKEMSRLRHDRNRHREMLAKKEDEVKDLKDQLLIKEQLNEELKAEVKILSAKVMSQSSNDTEIENLKKELELLREKKASKDQQLIRCMKDKELEKRAREEAQKFLAKMESEKQRLIEKLAKTNESAERNRIELTKRHEQTQQNLEKLKRELKSERMAKNTLHSVTPNKELMDKLMITENYYKNQMRLASKLYDEKNALQKTIEDMKKSFHTQLTALRNQRKYFESSAENNKRKRIRAEYALAKKRKLDDMKMAKIATEEQMNTQLVFDSLAKTISIVLKEHKISLDANNAQQLAKINRESIAKENEFIDNSKKLLEMNDQGKFECPECSFTMTSVSALTTHMSCKHGVAVEQPKTRVIDTLDLTDD